MDPGWVFDARRFSEFSWLVVTEAVPLDRAPGERAVPVLFTSLAEDLGEIQPHKERFPTAVEAALFAILLLPWENWAGTREID